MSVASYYSLRLPFVGIGIIIPPVQSLSTSPFPKPGYISFPSAPSSSAYIPVIPDVLPFFIFQVGIRKDRSYCE